MLGFYRRVMRYEVSRLRKENKRLKVRNKELETLSFALGHREQQLAEMERLLIARSQHYDANNPRIRTKINRLRDEMVEHAHRCNGSTDEGYCQG